MTSIATLEAHVLELEGYNRGLGELVQETERRLGSMRHQRDAARLVADAAVLTEHQSINALVLERRAHQVTASRLVDLQTNERLHRAHARDQALLAAFQDPDDLIPIATRPTMPSNALRQPRRTGWQAVR